MIKSTVCAGQIIESALKRAHMMPPGKFGLSLRDTYYMLDQTVLEVLKLHFETDKEQYYEQRIVQARTNGKFAVGGGSYDSATQTLTVTTVPAGSQADIGKVVTFFDSNVMPFHFYAGMIMAYNANQYVLSLFYPIPDLPNVVNVTVGDWLIAGDVISIMQPNEILAPENLDVYDISNNANIEIVDLEEFHYRLTINKWKTSDLRWGRYMQTRIEFASGSKSAPLGTTRISAYWTPPKTTSLGSPAYVSDKRVGEVEERLVQKLLSVKTGELLPEASISQAEIAQAQLEDKDTRESQSEVR